MRPDTPTQAGVAAAGPADCATLARVLGLRPLDRVQIASQRDVREIVPTPGAGQPAERERPMPYVFFQRVSEDGKLLVRSPNAMSLKVDACDVSDVIAGVPVAVRAIPYLLLDEHCRRMRRREVCDMPADDDSDFFKPAHVLYVRRGKWGLEEVFVEFDDPAHNAGRSEERTERAATVRACDRKMLAAATRRTMPVASLTHSKVSAEVGVHDEMLKAAAGVRALIRAGLAGDEAAVRRLAVADAGVDARACHTARVAAGRAG